MTAAIAMNVPGPRLVAGWWRDLATHRPRRLWFAHLVVHHIEALVECDAFASLDVLSHALLRLLQQRTGPILLADLQAWLELDSAMLSRLIDHLQAHGSLGRGGDGLTVYAASGPTAALASPPSATHLRQRRVFHFTDDWPALFVPLAEFACIALMPPAGWSFDLGCLETCLAQPSPWRLNNCFPEDVRHLLRPAQLPEVNQPEGIAVDRAEQSLLVLLQTEVEVLGFPVSPEGWELHREAALVLPLSADFSQSLLAPLPAEQWRMAWQGWCQQRSLPGSEVEACKLEPIDSRLLVQAPGRLVDRLRQSRGEASRGDTWLLAGTGRVRHAAQIELAS